MKRIGLFQSSGFLIVTVIAVLAFTPPLATARPQDCWVDFYESPNYADAHIRIKGPVQLRNLRSVQGENWASRIDSLIVGPKAQVKIYENTNFKLTLMEMAKHPDLMRSLGVSPEEVGQESELIFHPDFKAHHLGEYNFHKKTKSLIIDCVK